MRISRRFTQTCPVCHRQTQQPLLVSCGGPLSHDLDLRPIGMLRHAMIWRVQVCPHCGYTYTNPDRKTSVSRKWLQQETFVTCSGIPFVSPFSKRFYRLYLICLEDGDIQGAFFGILNAAWECDDVRDTENAVLCRKLAIKEIEKLIAAEPHREERLVQKADLLRRAGLFEQLFAEYRNVAPKKPYHQKLIDFELDKAARGETRCYSTYHVESYFV